jgi:hypothetical protein
MRGTEAGCQWLSFNRQQRDDRRLILGAVLIKQDADREPGNEDADSHCHRPKPGNSLVRHDKCAPPGLPTSHLSRGSAGMQNSSRGGQVSASDITISRSARSGLSRTHAASPRSLLWRQRCTCASALAFDLRLRLDGYPSEARHNPADIIQDESRHRDQIDFPLPLPGAVILRGRSNGGRTYRGHAALAGRPAGRCPAAGRDARIRCMDG